MKIKDFIRRNILKLPIIILLIYMYGISFGWGVILTVFIIVGYKYPHKFNSLLWLLPKRLKSILPKYPEEFLREIDESGEYSK